MYDLNQAIISIIARHNIRLTSPAAILFMTASCKRRIGRGPGGTGDTSCCSSIVDPRELQVKHNDDLSSETASIAFGEVVVVNHWRA